LHGVLGSSSTGSSLQAIKTTVSKIITYIAGSIFLIEHLIEGSKHLNRLHFS